MGMRKRGIFFSTDSLIAISLIFIVILIAYPLLKQTTHETTIQYDVIKTLSSIKASQANDQYTQSLIAQGLIKDTNRSMLEVIGNFYVTNKTIAQELAQSLLQELDIPSNVGIWYGDTLLAAKNTTPYETAKDVQTTRQVISGVEEGQSVTGFSARASLTNKLQKKYVYFGGYIGDGNISTRIDYNGTLRNATLEIATNTNFDVYINQNYAGTYSKSPSVTIPATYNLPTTSFKNGTNTIDLQASNLSVSGGFLKITYETEAQYEQPIRYYFPGIQGIINIYDGLYIPGKLNTLAISLHYNTTQAMTLSIGNTTIFNGTGSGETVTNIPNSQLTNLLNYTKLVNSTSPVRLGLDNISILGSGLSNVDVVLITDTSGSMDWRLDSDVTGTTRNNCSDPLLSSPSTKRISLAKCLDKSFISTILNASSDSRVALVSFSNDANTYVNLTRNETLLYAAINSYGASGATCVSCSINRAYSVLQIGSNSSRVRYVVTMTDGVTNRRSTPVCTDLLGSSSSTQSTLLAGGEAGTMLAKQPTSWSSVSSPTSNQINDIDLLNRTWGFAAGNNGALLKWNGSSWTNLTSPLSSTLSGLDILNSSFAIGVGASGKVVKWNGSSWSTLATISNSPTLSAVTIVNSTLIFAAGTRSNTGRIYKSVNGGTSWSEDYAAGNNFWGIKAINATVTYAVGDSGQIARRVGNSWSSVSSPTSEDLYSINAYNSTLAWAVGGDNGKSIAIQFNGATWSSSLNVPADSLRDLEVFANQTIAFGEGATIYDRSASTWTRQFSLPNAFQGNNTGGISCTSDEESCSEPDSFPALNANYSSCRVHQDLNATVYAIGFGPIESCTFANQTLQAIAQCGNGTFYSSSNATLLQQFYADIANNIIKVSFNEQTVETQGNISTKLYPDSSITFNYTTPLAPYGLIITTEKLFDTNTTASFSVPSNTTLLEAQVLSYSGPRWTTELQVNNITVYNLSAYGSNFLKLGDPYIIHIPLSTVQSSNQITLKTGVSPQNTSVGSAYNKVVYTLVKNASGYSPILYSATGCVWSIEFDSGANLTATIPSNYTGANLCYYRSDHTLNPYDPNDAAQTAVYRLLQSIDLNNNNKVDVELAAQDVEISLTQLTGIPYPWSTEVQVRTWR